jgi:uncharacterized OB-fold protein
VWSFVTFYKKYFAGFAADVPYDAAMIKLDEGPFLLTNIVNANGKPTAIGQRVAVTFQQRQGDLVVPQFMPAEPKS